MDIQNTAALSGGEATGAPIQKRCQGEQPLPGVLVGLQVRDRQTCAATEPLGVEGTGEAEQVSG